VESRDLASLPPDLPAPEDDGAADHLVAGFALPHVLLPATGGTVVDLAALSGRTALFAYPRTGRPGQASPGGDAAWDALPGARGCTPQACAIRDLHVEFAALEVRALGLSTQSPEDQREAAARLHLPYPPLSDPEARLPLPTFVVTGVTLSPHDPARAGRAGGWRPLPGLPARPGCRRRPRVAARSPLIRPAAPADAAAFSALVERAYGPWVERSTPRARARATVGSFSPSPPGAPARRSCPSCASSRTRS